MIALAALGFGAGRFLLGTEYAPFLGTVIAWMVASTGFNLFGMDDRSFWAYVVSGVDLRRILAGKNLALALIGVPAVTLVAVLMSVIAGEFSHLSTAILAALGGPGGVARSWQCDVCDGSVSHAGIEPVRKSQCIGGGRGWWQSSEFWWPVP